MAETARQLEYDRYSTATALYIGELALSRQELGINDPLTHLEHWLRQGDEALPIIGEDLDSEILERLPDPFENIVDFTYQNGDFISVKDQVSLKKITAENRRILAEEAKQDQSLRPELFRAQTEAREVHKLEEWFLQAPAGSVFIAESPPLGKQTTAIARLHFKVDGQRMRECIVELHNPTVVAFNQLRSRLGAGKLPAQTSLELLADTYALELPEGFAAQAFVDHYVASYDSILQNSDPAKQPHAYGVAGLDKAKIQTNRQKIAQNTALKEIYIHALKYFGSSEGVATPELVSLASNLQLEHGFHLNQQLTLDDMRQTMRAVLQSIVGTLDRAELSELRQAQVSPNDYAEGSAYDLAGHYGSQARAAGQVYESACPTFERSSSPEGSVLTRGYNLALQPAGEIFKDFGKAKFGVCRVPNCLSRGFGKKPEKTIVGGCDFCRECHVMLKNNKKPVEEHAKRRQKIAQEKAKAAQKQRKNT